MFRIYMMLLVFAASGCGFSGMLKTARQTAAFGDAVERQTVQASVEEIVAALHKELPVSELRAQPAKTQGARTVVIAIPPEASGWEKALTAGLKMAGSTDDYGDSPRGCRIEILDAPGGRSIRAQCFEVMERGEFERKSSSSRAATQRVEYRNAYLIARVIERVEPAAAPALWAQEPSGHRVRRCANGPSFLNFGCDDPAKRPPQPDEK